MGLPFEFVIEDKVALLTLSRPKTLNSITFEVYAALEQLFREAPRDDRYKAMVLTGSGKGFCSGGDVHEIIGELLERDMEGLIEFTRMTGEVVRLMRQCPQPIVAAVNGLAAGAGAVLALACDLRVCAASARFAFLFTKVGLTGADMGAGYLLPRVVGLGRASELLLLGDTIDAETAERYGLANRVVADEEVVRDALQWAGRLAKGPTLALAMTKRMLQDELDMDLGSAIEAEAQAQALMLQGRDHRAFYEAFKDKREPEFRGE